MGILDDIKEAERAPRRDFAQHRGDDDPAPIEDKPVTYLPPILDELATGSRRFGPTIGAGTDDPRPSRFGDPDAELIPPPSHGIEVVGSTGETHLPPHPATTGASNQAPWKPSWWDMLRWDWLITRIFLSTPKMERIKAYLASQKTRR